MQRILTAEQMRSADKFTIENLGVSETELVKRAGQAVSEEILKRFMGGRVLVCIGKGNNGKDGQIIAEILSKKHGFSVAVVNISNGMLKLFDRKYDIIVDCLFGTGLNRIVEGKYKTAIEKINKSGAFVISCDIPSGLNGTSGRVMGVAVKANLTVAIQELKLGHFINDGIDYSGEVVVKDIGISIWGDDFVKRLNRDSLSRYFLPRARNSHKGSFGKCALIGGSRDYSGSILLSAMALSAFKMGVGYVNIIVPDSLFNAYVGKVPECILTSNKDMNGQMQLDIEVLDKILHYDAIAVGMGMGCSQGTYDIVSYLLKNYKGKLIIDADGLNALSQFGLYVLNDKTCEVVLTPHLGEFSRLSCLNIDEIKQKTVEYVSDFARHNKVTLLLKNAVSVVCGNEEIFLNTKGSVGMAKAGSGDVLSGIITGLITANKEEPICETVAAACYVFGLSGEIVERKQNVFTMTASDLIAALPETINSIMS